LAGTMPGAALRSPWTGWYWPAALSLAPCSSSGNGRLCAAEKFWRTGKGLGAVNPCWPSTRWP